MPVEPLVAMRGIRKSFGPAAVLHGVDFEVLPGEVHVLAGENGAGKSTLIKILAGVYDDFAGDLIVAGRARRFTRPQDAGRAGIATIHQELSLVPSMSVADNLFMGRELTRRSRWIDTAAQEAEARRILRTMLLDVSPRDLVQDLSFSSRQLLEIARAFAFDARVFVFDEPTSALQEHEVESLFTRIVDLRGRGCGIVYISHRMEEIYRLADRITVLRDGRVVGAAVPGELPASQLVRWMVGREPGDQGVRSHDRSQRAALEVENLAVREVGSRGHRVVDGVSFALRQGEILGLAGLRGSGTSDLLHALFGALRTRASGQVRLFGEPVTIRSPQTAIARGIMLLTNDRKGTGLAQDLSVTANVSLASLARYSTAVGWVRRREEREAVTRLTSGFRLGASVAAPVRTLSGGSQQKVYLARCLLAEPRILLLDEPTRGIDVAAKADIYELMHEWVERGIGIVLITSELEELLALSDRILVMHRGRIVAELEGAAASKELVLAAAMGHRVTAAAR